MKELFAKKPIQVILNQVDDPLDDSERSLQRTLGPIGLIALGIGAIIGAGLFVRTAAAAANHAGPAVTIAYMIACLGCAFAGLCYAEFASMLPVAGSAYTYSYATMGELVAWIIGWDLILEYAVAAGMVAIAWSQYLNQFLSFFGFEIPFQWCHSPFEKMYDDAGNVTSQGIMNAPALLILFAITWVLARGMKQSAIANGLIVILKVTIVCLFIVLGWSFINPLNHIPYIPQASLFTDAAGITHHFGGWLGILGASGVVFFAFIGFDAVSTAAQETVNPKRNMPIGILGSLLICTVLYVLFSHVLTGLGTIEDFRTAGREASVAFVIQEYMPGYSWLSKLITVAILAGFSSVILVMLLGQSRVFYSMSKDGLVPKVFSELHPKYHTPAKSNWIFFAFISISAAFLPIDILGDMTSIGTLFAFILVCAGILIIRKREPNAPRGFKTPYVPWVPLAGIIICSAMIYGLGWMNWLRLGIWMLIGFAVYFVYARKHSKQKSWVGG